jgi:formamidopyrimidine-DNA glycosylase
VPELPDITVYIEALQKRILGERLEHVRIASPFLLRTAAPPVADVEGKTVVQICRLGKRICIGMDNDIWLVLHLMIAGRLHWRKRGVKLSPPRGLAAFDFANGTLLWTARPCMWWQEKRGSLRSIPADSKFCKPIWSSLRLS